MEPINYMLDVKSPIEQALMGYGLGRQDIEQTQIMQERSQAMGLRAAQESRAAAAAEEQRAAAAKERAKADAMQAQLMQLRQSAIDGKLTVDALNEYALGNADTFAEFATAFSAIETAKRKPQVQFNIETTIPALTGNPAAALALFDERIAAAENTGTPEAMAEAQALRANRAILEADPRAYGVSMLGTLVATRAIDDKQADTILKLAGQDQAAPEGASPLGKMAQDVANGLIPQSVLDAAIKLEQKAGQEGLTLQQKIAEEARLRGEYAKRTEDLGAAERNFSIIETSSMDQSGAGDIALVTSFMKMLDPGSVVRETEFATAANAGGLLARLTGIAAKVEDGQFLSERQRADFTRLAGEYLKAAKAQEQGVQQSFQLIVDNYGLDPVNVFGARAATAAAAPAGTVPATAPAPAPAPAPATIPQGFINNTFIQQAVKNNASRGVTVESLWNAMTPEERAIYGK
jgi:hypothetical protein